MRAARRSPTAGCVPSPAAPGAGRVRRDVKRAEDMDITEGSGNIFADLGLPDPEVRLMKARLAGRIQDAIEARGWTPEQVARLG